MKVQNHLSLLIIALFLNSNLAISQNISTTKKVSSSIEVIQFHSEHRCMTCNKIEDYTKETLNQYVKIPFTLVNVDDVKNEKKAEKFEATGTALFLHDTKTGKKKDLTDFAFMNASNKEKFIKGLKKEIDQF
ncbi:MAG TPA: nitrophenyl compound nitroreductase subunit ArsF family protein [Saprospiraceae bacterium]|nr:nitrophenyl compound nitroreductase subunit ArsF family protein [Saprospiraceae bacterium]